jgi:hypothetical protein
MKRLIIAWFLLAFAISGKSTTIPLDSIKLGIVAFIKDVERANTSVSDWSNFLIGNREGYIEEGKDGIFIIGVQVVISSGAHIHFLLVEKDSFQILNLTEPIDVNVMKLVNYFERNSRYCKDDILFYMKALVATYQRNEEYIKSFNGIIM